MYVHNIGYAEKFDVVMETVIMNQYTIYFDLENGHHVMMAGKLF
jgi:hypothetical protein